MLSVDISRDTGFSLGACFPQVLVWQVPPLFTRLKAPQVLLPWHSGALAPVPFVNKEEPLNANELECSRTTVGTGRQLPVTAVVCGACCPGLRSPPTRETLIVIISAIFQD